MINFFINRPIFATVIALIMVIAGSVCYVMLPVAQYPQIAPPKVEISSEYAGASAKVVSDAVTLPIEEEVNGVKHMTYMASNSTNNGTSDITITFEVGTDLDIAAVNVQNKLSVAKPLLPEEVTRSGVKVEKKSPNLMMVVNLVSPNGTYDDAYLGNYADIHIADAIKRIPGVGKILNFGLKKYSIRLWLNPDRLAAMGLTATDVADAVREQNVQVAAGKVGAAPSRSGKTFEFQINAKGRLNQASEFEDIIVRTRDDGSIVRVSDVARVELGAENYTMSSSFNGKATASIGIYQLPGANAIDLSKAIHAEMAQLAKRFPQDLTQEIAYDTSKFVKASMQEVMITLYEAIALVVLVVFVFLQDWRITLIPVIAIPVSLIATFAILMAFGFSINSLSLLGLVLAIGLVVDDAIVVVENVQRQLEEGETDLKKAARVAMAEVAGPIVATTLVLLAVFVPVAFMPGLTGRLYNQFALTIAFSVLLSGINSLTLSPALSAVFLRPPSEKKFFLFEWFNRGFERFAEGYKRLVALFIRYWYFTLAGFAAFLVVVYWMFQALPGGFVPEEDQGYLMAAIQTPDASTLERTNRVTERVAKMMLETPGVADVLAVGGFNLIDTIVQSNTAFVIAVLKPWDERSTPETQLDGIMNSFNGQFAAIDDALVFAFNAPPIPGLGSMGGFQFEVQDLNGQGIDAVAKATNDLIAKGNQRPELAGLMTTLSTEVPQLHLDIDRTKAKAKGLRLSDVFDSLQIYLGSLYVNDFNKYGRTYRVLLQAEKDARMVEEDIAKIHVRNQRGEMIPLSALVKTEPTVGPINVPHYNIYNAAQINGNPAPGFSSGQAIKAMEEVAKQALPEGIGFAWTGTVYQQLKAGDVAPYIFALSMVFVFLFLAAQYESWAMPFMIILAVPTAMFGAAAALLLRGLDLNVYGQIGLVMLIGLAAKNAILIVEFAKQLHEKGETITDAAVHAAKMRLRPILMTAFAFILGVLPLAIATGAGENARRALGTTVLGGMIAAVAITIIVVPTFYVVIERLRERGARKPVASDEVQAS